MHVIKVLHKQLQKTGSIHKKRLESLFDIVETAMQTQYVTLTGLGRRLFSSIKIKHKIKKVGRLDKEIKQRYKNQKKRIIFDSLPGAGSQLAPRIFVAFGSDRTRYQSANEIQKCAGIAPVIEQSGQKKWTHWRYSCPKFLRQTFVECAGQSIRYSFWARAYYEQQLNKGKPHNTIIRSLAFKWIRIVYKCWQTNTPYDESKYLKALQRQGSPLLNFAVNG